MPQLHQYANIRALPHHLILPFGLTALLASCSACPAEAELLRSQPDLSSAEQTCRTFLAAFSCDDSIVEYRCLSEELKERHGATLDGWILAREDLRDEIGFSTRFAHTLQLSARQESPRGTVLWFSHADKTLVGFHCVPQPYFELTTDDGREVGAFLDGELDGSMEVDGKTLQLRLHDPALRMLQGQIPRSLEVGTEWKIQEVVTPNTSVSTADEVASEVSGQHTV
ncbi:MAG: hypothetical protein MK213_07280 [Planctomycetes bacterium]|nr:hypothetical protein [Planctomycetota bacterium]